MTSNNKCKPTPSLAWGPLWFPGHPLLTGSKAKDRRICRAEDDGVVILASSIFSRSKVSVDSIELKLSGQVLDEDCQPIKGAIVDFWQPDSKGRYSFSPDGECRGAVKTDEKGRYSVITHLPGSYGVTAGCGYSLYGMELPPFSLRHIHAAVFSPSHKVMATQLTFPDDVARNKDFRELLAPGSDLSNPEVELTVKKLKDGSHEAVWDFVIEQDLDSAPEDLFTNQTALHERICLASGLDLGEPFPLCQSNGLGKVLPIQGVATLLLPTMLYGVPMLVLFITYKVLLKVKSGK